MSAASNFIVPPFSLTSSAFVRLLSHLGKATNNFFCNFIRADSVYLQLIVTPSRSHKESLLRQRSRVIWLFGLSASGKTTLSNVLAEELHRRGILATQLDGDDLRLGLSKGLGFSDADRTENLRRAAEVARLLSQSGIVALCSFITPLRAQRDMIRQIVGEADLSAVHVAASLEACIQRDPKGLYSQAKSGRLVGLTGYEARFEPPAAGENILTLETAGRSPAECAEELLKALLPAIRPAG